MLSTDTGAADAGAAEAGAAASGAGVSAVPGGCSTIVSTPCVVPDGAGAGAASGLATSCGFSMVSDGAGVGGSAGGASGFWSPFPCADGCAPCQHALVAKCPGNCLTKRPAQTDTQTVPLQMSLRSKADSVTVILI